MFAFGSLLLRTVIHRGGWNKVMAKHKDTEAVRQPFESLRKQLAKVPASQPKRCRKLSNRLRCCSPWPWPEAASFCGRWYFHQLWLVCGPH